MSKQYGNKIITSVYGRRLGLQALTTPESGSGNGRVDLLVGAEALRVSHTTADTTATNLKPYGHSYLSSASSSGVYTIDPPIPGVNKTVTFGTSGATIYLKSANSETFVTTQGTSQTILKSTQNVPFTVVLVPNSTSQWGVVGAGSSAIMSASTTT
jgi:hypothetical protein